MSLKDWIVIYLQAFAHMIVLVWPDIAIVAGTFFVIDYLGW